MQRINRRAELCGRLIIIRELLVPIRDDDVRLGLGLRDRDSRFEAADDTEAARAARLEVVFRKRDRLPHVRALRERSALDAEKRQRELELRRHDPNDGVTVAVHRDLRADELRIGIEAPPPETFADHDNVVVAFAEFVLVEDPAFNRRDAQDRKQTRRHYRALDALRHVAPSEIEVREVESRDPLITPRLFFPIEIFRR